MGIRKAEVKNQKSKTKDRDSRTETGSNRTGGYFGSRLRIPNSAFPIYPKTYLVILVLLLAFIPPLVGNYWTQVLGDIGIYVMLGIGLNVVVGFAGLLDLGYVAFYAIGAYGYALLASPHFGIHIPFW